MDPLLSYFLVAMSMILISADDKGRGVHVTSGDAHNSMPFGSHSPHICTTNVLVAKCPNLWNDDDRNCSKMPISNCVNKMDASIFFQAGEGRCML